MKIAIKLPNSLGDQLVDNGKDTADFEGMLEEVVGSLLFQFDVEDDVEVEIRWVEA